MTSTTPSQSDDRGEPIRRSALGQLSEPAPALIAESETEPEPSRLLFLDDDPARAVVFLNENPRAVWVQTVVECVSRLAEPWDEVHLDHDLGGKTFVNTSDNDCGMEVIRWLCQERRDHLLCTQFFVHTHNSLAGLLMVLQMHESGYKAEFRPFGADPALFLDRDDDMLSFDDAPVTNTNPRRSWPNVVRRWIGAVKARWTT